MSRAPRRNYATPEEALAARVERDGECLLWTGATMTSGYGTLRVKGRMEGAHRFAWMKANGPIPEGLVVDHLCHVRRCVEVSHLRLVTPTQNTRARTERSRGVTGFRNVYFRRGRYYGKVHKEGKVYFTPESYDLWQVVQEVRALRRRLFGEHEGEVLA